MIRPVSSAVYGRFGRLHGMARVGGFIPRIVGRFGLLCACLAMALACIEARGEPGVVGRGLTESVFGDVDAELMVQFDNLASRLRTPAGESLRRMLAELGVFERTGRAWEGLSGTLGLDPESAIDRLLGGRVLLIADGLGKAEARWACVMSVDAEMGRLLPRRLKASPRESLNGRTVYAMEDGRFRVMLVESRGGSGVRALAIAQAGAEAMLRAGSELGARWEAGVHEVAPVGDRVAVLLHRPVGGRWVWGELSVTEEGWRLRASGPAGLFDAITGGGGAAVGGDWYREISEGALIAMAGPVDAAAGRPPLLAGPMQLAWNLLPFNPPEAFVGGGADVSMVAVHALGGGRLDFSVGYRVRDLRHAARVADEYVCGEIGRVSGGAPLGIDAPVCTGRYPEARRRQTVVLDHGAALVEAYGQSLSFVWGGADRAARDGSGWWLMRVSGGAMLDLTPARAPGNRPSVGMPGAEAARGDRMLAAGVMRPRALLGSLEGEAFAGGDGWGPVGALRWVEEFRWEVAPSSEGVEMVVGDFRIRMRVDGSR